MLTPLLDKIILRVTRMAVPRQTIAGSQSSDIRFLFVDTESDKVVTADGINLVDPGMPRLDGRISEALDEDEEDTQAWTGFGNLVPSLGMNECTTLSEVATSS